MICSVLIPSRARFARLLSSVDSIRRTGDASQIEILVRLDVDDKESIERISELGVRGVKVMIGPRYKGHASLHDFYNELAAGATAPWVLFLNDDITLESNHPGWLQELSAYPTHGFMPVAKYYRLGQSFYDAPALVCPIVPNKCWLNMGWDRIPSCVDEAFYSLLIKEHRWSVVVLPSLCINHQRDNDELLRQHRLMGGKLA